MLSDGLYRVAFKTPLGAGTGVIYLRDGKLWGGDMALYYVGTYSQDGNEFQADVTTARHTDYPEIRSVFGIDRVHIILRGTATESAAKTTGSALEAPGIPFSAESNRLSD